MRFVPFLNVAFLALFEVAYAGPLQAADIAIPRSPQSKYLYVGNGVQVNNDTSWAIEFNGLPIGTAELSPTATAGTVHSLASGHHFYHDGWYLTDTNGGACEYRNQTVTKRDTRLRARFNNLLVLDVTSPSCLAVNQKRRRLVAERHWRNGQLFLFRSGFTGASWF